MNYRCASNWFGLAPCSMAARLRVLCLIAAASFTTQAFAATPQEVAIWPGVAPGSEKAEQKEQVSPFPGGKFNVVRNVTRPTLTVYLPDPSKATGTGVIVAPGGAFRMLTIDAEGNDVARWLVERGIAAFVLKYRLIETPGSDALMWTQFMARMAAAKMSGTASFADDAKLGIADGIQAVKVVRAHADEWNIAPDRIGFVGFSAGGMVASFAMLTPAEAARPDFVAPIYGAPLGEIPKIPSKLPPVFLAYASDDGLIAERVDAFHGALRKAGHHPELHIYRKGGHGFGMNQQGLSSDYWIEDLYHWMESLGYTRATTE
ncbi:alpha/beta hydrolase [Peristeroidobacter soli]|uniref:alpha/beta hydrolase n=1 Tax=Peristeroidobacter soli TaxID=2497877 RepID=UPI00130090E0|nr:alpha/beta hydrolase [Peristeroidobacter soli]